MGVIGNRLFLYAAESVSNRTAEPKAVPNQPQAVMSLTAVAGPDSPTLELVPPGPLTIGRRSTSTLCLDGEYVSRDHVRLHYRESSGVKMWVLEDTESKHGTRLNGWRVKPGQEYPINHDDRIEIRPWMFRVVDHRVKSQQRGLVLTEDDRSSGGSTIARIETSLDRELAGERLALLLRCAEGLHAAADQAELAEAVIDAAIAGTNFTNVALLGPLTDATNVEVTAFRSLEGNPSSSFAFSRSLITRAAVGMPVRLTTSVGQMGMSVMQLGIREALCVPLIVDESVEGFLYLDDRGSGPSREIAADAAEFAVGLAQLAALAKANLSRMDLYRRQSTLEAELRAAAEAQRLILPRREGRIGGFDYIGESRPGRWVGGDFFDVFELPHGRVAVAVGDVTGKGISAAVMMTTAQGYLHAALTRSGDPGESVTALNRFLAPRAGGRYLTLWVGVIDPHDSTLRYVDAGHGFAWVVDEAGDSVRLQPESGIWLCVETDHVYREEVKHLKPGWRLVVATDGFVEQVAAGRSGRTAQFGVSGVERALSAVQPGGDMVEHLFAAVDAHAGGAALADDATAVCIEAARVTHS